MLYRTGVGVLLILITSLAECARRGQKIEEVQAFGPPCRKFSTQKCGLLHKKGLPKEPFCHPGNGIQYGCSFDTRSLQSCPLASEGRFVKDETITQCRLDSRTYRRVFANPTVPRTCGPNCCSTDLEGSFQAQKDVVGLSFQPKTSDCRYHQYTWREAMECLKGAKIVIAGDSIMRQLFNMGITMMRGQEVAIDYNKHAHGRYRVCREGDKLEFGTFVPSRFEIPLEEIAQLYAPSSDSFELCSGKPIVEVDYMWAPRFIDLVPSLEQYQKVVVGQPGQRIVYITFAGFWEDREEVPQEFLNTVDALRRSADAVLMMSVPRTRLFGEPNKNAGIRNDKMRQWVENRTAEKGNVHYVDFDKLARSEGAPEGMGSLNWHYQCFLDFHHLDEVATAVGHLDDAWYWPEAPEHIFPSLWTAEGGGCADDMDRNLWQIIFNLLCNTRTNLEEKPMPGRDDGL